MHGAIARAESPRLIKYDAMCKAIEAAHGVDEVKEIRNRAVAFEAYAKQAMNYEAERQAAQIRIRAERRCGEFLAEDENKAKGGEHGGKRKIDGNRTAPSNPTPTLEERGITKRQSSDWQKLAAVPRSEFEEILTQPGVPTTSGVIALSSKAPEAPVREPIDDLVLSIWGLLERYERTGVFATAPDEFARRRMEPMMKSDIARRAAMAAEWFSSVAKEFAQP